MAKAEWGMKRVCQGCTAHYYDLKKDPAVCPICGEKFDPESYVRTRRRGNAKDSTAPTISLVELDSPLLEEEAFIDPDLLEGEASDDAGDDVLEDASDLGGDEGELIDVDVDHDGKDR
jgi:uncharacterized protein (TIGR02300 family)